MNLLSKREVICENMRTREWLLLLLLLQHIVHVAVASVVAFCVLCALCACGRLSAMVHGISAHQPSMYTCVQRYGGAEHNVFRSACMQPDRFPDDNLHEIVQFLRANNLSGFRSTIAAYNTVNGIIIWTAVYT